MLKVREGLRKQALSGILYKLLSLLLTYLTIPIIINLLGTEKYGLWVTIASVFGWFQLFDLGIGSSMQNKLTEAIADNDNRLQRVLVSSSYGIMIFVTVIVLIAGAAVILLVPAGLVLDTLSLTAVEIRTILFIFLFTTAAGLFLRIYTNIYNAYRKTSIPLLAGFISQLIIFLLFTASDRMAFCISMESAAIIKNLPVIILPVFFTAILFKSCPEIKPSFKYVNRETAVRIGTTGILFFIIHLCWTVINSTDNLIISNRIGSAEVTVYSLIRNIIMLGKTFFILLLTPFWPQFADLYHRRKAADLKKLLRRYFLIMTAINTATVIGSLFIPEILYIWTGKNYEIPEGLVFYTALFFLIDNLVALFTYCLNAVGRIKLQAGLYVLGGIINIPLSLILIKPYGITGVIIASCISYIPLAVLMPVQALLFIKKENKKWSQ